MKEAEVVVEEGKIVVGPEVAMESEVVVKGFEVVV